MVVDKMTKISPNEIRERCDKATQGHNLTALLDWCERMRLLLDCYLIQPPLNAMSFKDFKKEAIKLLSELEP